MNSLAECYSLHCIFINWYFCFAVGEEDTEISEITEKDNAEEDEDEDGQEKTIIDDTPPEEQKDKNADNAAESVLSIMMMFLEGEV